MKICAGCGRVIEPRKKWLLQWDQIKYCSEKCRRNKKDSTDEAKILELLKIRGFDKTICPSEILAETEKQNKIRMEEVRSSARILVSKGEIVIMQKGRVIDPSTGKGLIRLKKLRKDV